MKRGLIRLAAIVLMLMMTFHAQAYAAGGSDLLSIRHEMEKNGDILAVAGIGYAEPGQRHIDLKDIDAQYTFEGMDFLSAIPPKRTFLYGTSLFCLVPEAGSTISFLPYAGFAENGDIIFTDVLYSEKSSGDPLVIGIEDFDILSNVFVRVSASDGRTVLYRPGWKLDDSGKIYDEEMVYDFTDYDAFRSLWIEYTDQKKEDGKTLLYGRVHNNEGRTVDSIGVILRDADGNELTRYEEECAYPWDSFTMWYNVEDELGITLEEGKEYSYIFFLTSEGMEITGEVKKIENELPEQPVSTQTEESAAS